MLASNFQNLSTDPSTLPYIEFSAIGLLCAPAEVTRPEQLLPIIQKLRHKEAPYDNLPEDYSDLPIIIAMGWRYFLHGNTDGNTWDFTELDTDVFRQRGLPFTALPFYLESDLQHVKIYHHIIEKKAHTYFSTEAQQITQIKKIYNSSFYILALLKQIEGIELSFTGFFNIGSALVNYINGTTYDHIHNAITLLGDTEIDFSNRLKDEASEFVQVLNQFKKLSSLSIETSPPPPGTYRPSSRFQVGHAAGFVTRYMYDEQGQWDIDVFSQFSVDLPKHIDLLTTLINSNNSKIVQHAPNINTTQLRALQKEATQLLKTLKHTEYTAKGSKLNPLNQVIQIINYAFLIRQIIVLGSTTLNQVGHLNDAYQETMRDILTILQKDGFSLIVRYALNLEIEGTLDPGLLSGPTIKTIHSFYHFLKERIYSLADFSFLGDHLLTIENSSFTDQLETFIQSKYQESQQEIQKIVWAREALVSFLSSIQTDNMSESSIQYAEIAYFVHKINPYLNRDISQALFSAQPVPFPEDTLRNLRCQLSAYLLKRYHTEILRARQCQDVRAALPKFLRIHLFPYHTYSGCDIALKVAFETPLEGLKLPQNHPVLIEYHQNSEISYYLYGNTNGTIWNYTLVADSFIPPNILKHFTPLRQVMLREDRQLHILPYHPNHQAFYLWMMLKKAHTQYLSQFSSLESTALNTIHDSLTTVITKPFIWLQKQWRNQPTSTEDSATPTTTNIDAAPMVTIVNQHHDFYPDLECLTVEQLLLLYGWYQQKINNYHEAVTHLEQFKLLINETFPNQLISFNKHSEVHQRCQYLYHLVRPYLIGIRNFPAFDLRMISALTVSLAPKKDKSGLHCQEMNQILGRFSLETRDIKTLIDNWKNRATQLFIYAKNKLSQRNRQILAERAVHFKIKEQDGFLFKTAFLSAKIADFHAALKLWIPILNKRTRDQLIPRANGTPYPEIQDLNAQLRHPPFLLFLKRIFNGTYHLEQVVKGLGRIRKGHTGKIKNETIDLITKIGLADGQSLFDIALQLRDDPVLGAICQDIYQQFQDIQHSVLNFTQPYTTNEKKINTHFEYRMKLIRDEGEEISTPSNSILSLVHHQNDYFIYLNTKDEIWELKQIPEGIVEALKIDFTQPFLEYDYHYQTLYDYILQHSKGSAGPFWFPLNALYTLPMHLLSITEQEHLDLDYRIQLVHDQGETVSRPPGETLTIIEHRQHYYLFGNGKGEDWDLYPLPTELIHKLDIDFTKTHLEYSHLYQDLYDYMLYHALHFTELNRLQAQAKTNAQNIQRIIRDSNHYFKLFFFDGWMIYQLNQELQTQLTLLTRTTQATILDHLETIHTKYFAPLLIKADTQEHQWDLDAGFITNTVEAIINECYQGLIFPLKKPYREKADLCTKDTILRARIAAEEQRFASLSIPNNERIAEIAELEAWIGNLRHFSANVPTGLQAYISAPPPISGFLVEQYTRIYPKLCQQREQFISEWIAIIPPVLNHENLPHIKTQVKSLYDRLAHFTILHNAKDRKLCEQLPIFLEQLTILSEQSSSEPISEALTREYIDNIVPKLHEQRQACVPTWLHPIAEVLDLNSLAAILKQSEAYQAYLQGKEAEQSWFKGSSKDKLDDLRQKLEHHQSHAIQDFCQSFAKHHAHTMINRLIYQASGLEHSKIHREYHRDLKRFLIAKEDILLHNLSPLLDVDVIINQRIQAQISAFKQLYFERFQRFDRLQTAINEFKDYLIKDKHLANRLRTKKMDCLNALENILYQKPNDNDDIEAFLNHRTQLLAYRIQQDEEDLLEHHAQFNNVIDWLIDCVFSLFIALGLYPSAPKACYQALLNADKPLAQLPPRWLTFNLFRSTPSTPPRAHRIIVQETPTPRNTT